MSKININNKYSSKFSVYFRQNATKCNFSTSESWIILSEIEQRIKAKIEAIGVPLKDWNINIYRGILTGYNEAFIIDGKKKDELIAEDPKSAEIIRPILRGRDIKRYSYDFADLWLINTHNGIKEKGIKPINIDNYPAVKAHLDNYYPQLEKRADKGETPYNLRNCAYMEDFSRPKVIYPNMTKFLPFVYDGKGFLTNQKCFIITGSKVEFLTAFLNSSLFKYCFKDDFPELQGGTRELSKIFFDKITVMQISEETNLQFKKIIDDIQQMKENGESTKELELIIDTLLFNLYNLKEEEIKEIGFIEIL
ncbi:type II restriction endonuclease [Riemerella anatipestifer]|nr:type II restriction endonuclease [Riemerella anatipestifer]UZF09016.1 type II restriction endonuclease [Riemerella anatipestifer]